MGLGSILGTGVFVSIGMAGALAGSSLLIAVAVAALVAATNGLSSASLAANHPVSGGTYAYGYRWLNPPLGFTAGWMFLCAKSASAATAALGFAGYALTLAGASDPILRTVIAAALVLAMTLLVAGGIQRSNILNTIIVGATLAALAAFVIAGLAALPASPEPPVAPAPAWNDLAEATALMFVAYTGYGRIATLGEEVRDPRRSIPRAIVGALLVTMLLYLTVTFVGVAHIGATGLAAGARTEGAPLVVAARAFDMPGVPLVVSLGALTAMAGVLLNLVLGLSRVLLAMARQGDMPKAAARVDHGSPRIAVYSIGALILGLVAIGDIRTTWTFSAFMVLVYYAITNLAALRLSPTQRRVPPIVPALGLLACLSLAFFVEPAVWATGLGLIASGLVWHFVARRRNT
jgi:APA family basic amino acid/polyamine antiporter